MDGFGYLPDLKRTNFFLIYLFEFNRTKMGTGPNTHKL